MELDLKGFEIASKCAAIRPVWYLLRYTIYRFRFWYNASKYNHVGLLLVRRLTDWRWLSFACNRECPLAHSSLELVNISIFFFIIFAGENKQIFSNVLKYSKFPIIINAYETRWSIRKMITVKEAKSFHAVDAKTLAV